MLRKNGIHTKMDKNLENPWELQFVVHRSFEMKRNQTLKNSCNHSFAIVRHVTNEKKIVKMEEKT